MEKPWAKGHGEKKTQAFSVPLAVNLYWADSALLITSPFD